MIIYQIIIKGGIRSSFVFVEKKYYSKNVFTTYPTPEQIEEFTKECCDSGDKYSYTDLDRESIKVTVNELIVI